MSDGGGWFVALAVAVVVALIIFGALGLSGALGPAH